MIKALLPLGLLVLSSFPALAQVPAAAPAPAPAPAATTPVVELSAGRRDTLGAISSLYERKRKAGKVWSGIAVGGGLALLRVLTADNTKTIGSTQVKDETDASGVAVIGALFVGLPVVIGLTNLAQFSEEKENEVDRAYRSGKPLPRNIARSLRKKDF